jgi:glycosyltransferase involved in cell wall biosynthesis
VARVVAVVPAFNEASHIAYVVKEALRHVGAVVVVDDHSADNTVGEARSAGATVIQNQTPISGAGHATQMGINYALFLKADTVVTLDGDGQHAPDEIPRLLRPIERQEADMVIGSRFLHAHKMPKYREAGEQFLVWTCGLRNGNRVSDILSGYRAFDRKMLERIRITDARFGFTVETLLKAQKSGFKVVEVPVSCIYHPEHGDNSTYNPWRHGIEELKAIVKWRWRLRGNAGCEY